MFIIHEELLKLGHDCNGTYKTPIANFVCIHLPVNIEQEKVYYVNNVVCTISEFMKPLTNFSPRYGAFFNAGG